MNISNLISKDSDFRKERHIHFLFITTDEYVIRYSVGTYLDKNGYCTYVPTDLCIYLI